MRGLTRQATVLALATGVLGMASVGFAEDLKIENGNKATLTYTLTVDGKKLAEGRSMEYTPGEDQIIPGVAEGLAGMKAGEKKQITVAPEKAFGPVDPEKLAKFPKEMLPEGVKVGSRLNTPFGPATVTEIGETEATLDFNHPLAGKTLIFDVEIITVVKA